MINHNKGPQGARPGRNQQKPVAPAPAGGSFVRFHWNPGGQAAASYAPPGSAEAVPGTSYTDPTYQAQLTTNNNLLTSQNAQFNNAENRLGLDYGFSFARNPDGTPADVQVDPTNPYSMAAQLKKRYVEGQARSTTGLAAQGQLYSGALQNALDSGTGQYNQGFSDLTRSFADKFGGLESSRTNAQYTHDINQIGYGSDAIARSINQFPALAPTAGPVPAPAAPRAAAPSAASVVRGTSRPARPGRRPRNPGDSHNKGPGGPRY